MKKILAIAVALVLLIGLIPIAGMMNAAAEEITFDFGANGSATHADGNKLGASKSYTSGSYTLALTGMANVYGPAYDAKGNSCIKLGASSKAASITFTAPDDVTSVKIYAAKYKTNTTKLKVNGTTHTLSKNSNNGEYDEITVDTSSSKTVKIETVSGGYRAMINTIVFVTGGDGDISEGTTTTTKPVVIYNTPEEILNAAEALASGEYLSDSHEYTLTGVITKVDSAYSNYRNVTVTMKVDGTEKTISCYRLTGTGANKIAVGDTITVKGAITKYNTTVRFGEGCQLASYTLLPRDPADPIEIPEGAIVTTFEFGANGAATHEDGDALSATKSYTSGDYTLALTGVTKVYGGAFDAKGNSCLKLATGSVGASFSFTVPDDVVKVIVKVAGYKDYPAKVKFNDVEKTIVTTLSNDGEYTEIEVDTTENKTVTIATSASNYLRAMIDSITYVAVEQEAVPTITDLEINTDSAFYDEETKTFFLGKEEPLVITLIGENFNLLENIRYEESNLLLAFPGVYQPIAIEDFGGYAVIVSDTEIRMTIAYESIEDMLEMHIGALGYSNDNGETEVDSGYFLDVIYYPSFTGRDLTLSDDLDVGFHLNIPEDYNADDMKVVFEVEGKTTEAPVVADADGKYVIHLEVPAKDMTTPITAKLVDSLGVEYAVIYTTVSEYCEDILNDYVTGVTPEDQAVAEAMLNYGAMAQLYFDHNTDTLANGGYETDLNAADVSAVAPLSISGNADTFLGASLVLKSKIIVRLYFSEAVEGAKQNTNGWYVDVEGIGAGDLNTVQTVTVGEATFNFSVLSFAKTVIEGAYEADFQNLMKALVLYSAAVEDM